MRTTWEDSTAAPTFSVVPTNWTFPPSSWHESQLIDWHPICMDVAAFPIWTWISNIRRLLHRFPCSSLNWKLLSSSRDGLSAHTHRHKWLLVRNKRTLNFHQKPRVAFNHIWLVLESVLPWSGHCQRFEFARIKSCLTICLKCKKIIPPNS